MKTHQFEVAGVKFRAKAFKDAEVARGDRLTLKREPENKYDPKAIAVYKGEHHIGYVPRAHNQALGEDMNREHGVCVDAVWKLGCWVVVNIKDDEAPGEEKAKEQEP